MNFKAIKLKELMRFLVGGGSAVCVDFGVYHFLDVIGILLPIAKGISFWIGAAVGFVINKIWTFKSKKFYKKEIYKFVILYSISACINTLINHFILSLTSVLLLSFLCATGVSTMLNFIGQKYFVFRKVER